MTQLKYQKNKNNITLIFLGFQIIAEALAEMTLKNNKTKIENPSQLILRNSL